MNAPICLILSPFVDHLHLMFYKNQSNHQIYIVDDGDILLVRGRQKKSKFLSESDHLSKTWRLKKNWLARRHGTNDDLMSIFHQIIYSKHLLLLLGLSVGNLSIRRSSPDASAGLSFRISRELERFKLHRITRMYLAYPLLIETHLDCPIFVLFICSSGRSLP
jgi:hypothetical protein